MTTTTPVAAPGITAAELRIGNWVLADGVPAAIIDIYGVHSKDGDVCCIVGKTHPVGELTPILLSPEILEKAGFEKRRGGEYILSVRAEPMTELYFVFGGKDARLQYDYDDGAYESHSSYFSEPRVAALHQLQNLFFALTSTELTITL